MTLLAIVVLAAGVVESRDTVRRDFLMDNAGLRSWYEARHARYGRALTRENVERALRRARTMRRWGPILLSSGTLVIALILTGLAASAVPGVESAWSDPVRLLDLIEIEALVQTAVVYALLPILVVEGILAALYVADLDIGRLRRLLDTLE